MNSIIKQLPDRLANQIAAGEVIQRPASVVKELLENAIDAGATEISLIVKDAGKELIQVIDNGKGMSAVDARMCFERHATSKIRDIQDLFTIKTMGFRGEAMASIAAVAQVEMITRTDTDEVGTAIWIEGTTVTKQEPTAAMVGTNIAVKNLFFNVPARRKFLKSNTVEWKHIVEEFNRVAMPHPHINFKLVHNDTEQVNLRAGAHKNRVVDILGNRFDKYLVSVHEASDYLKVYGFIGKPEIAGRTKNNQYFFINNRYIRSSYLHHAVVGAFEGLITKEDIPFYVLYLELDPEKVDVNVHPTKQEVKFEDERTIYSYLKSIVRHVLAKFNITPSLDFTLDTSIQQLESMQLPASHKDIQQASNSYLSQSFSRPNSAHFIDKVNSAQQWEQQRNTFFDTPANIDFEKMANMAPMEENQESIAFPDTGNAAAPQQVLYWNGHLVTGSKSGLMIIHIQAAQERILYDQLIERFQQNKPLSQQLLYPEMIECSMTEMGYIEELIPELLKLGFEISSMGGQTFAIHGIPPELQNADIQQTIRDIIDAYEYNNDMRLVTLIDQAIRTTAAKAKQSLDHSLESYQALLAQLFASSQPEYTPRGQKIISIYNPA